MSSLFAILPLVVSTWSAAGVVPSPKREEPLACRMDALSAPQRERHRLLSEALARAVVASRELPNGYELSVDPSRLPADPAPGVAAPNAAHGLAALAEWVELESRCCPFLDFDLGVRGRGGLVRLSLTGGAGVKEFLREEIGFVAKGRDILPR